MTNVFLFVICVCALTEKAKCFFEMKFDINFDLATKPYCLLTSELMLFSNIKSIVSGSKVFLFDLIF